MLKLRMFLMGLLIGGGGLYCADRYHMVQTQDGLIVVRRAVPVYLRSTYADVRSWTESKWSQYPDLTSALLQAGYHNVLSGGRREGVFSPRGFSADTTGFSRSSGEAPLPWWRRAGDESPSLPPPETPPAAQPAPTSSPPPTIGAARSAPLVEEDSLLERLTRQLREGAATVPPAERTTGLRERPLTRQPISTPAAPPPAPAQNAVSPPPPDRAALPPSTRPSDLLPSIHAAGLEQVPASRNAAEGEAPPAEAIAASAVPVASANPPDEGQPVRSDLATRTPLGEAAGSAGASREERPAADAESWRAAENWSRPVLREASVHTTIPAGASAEGNRVPVEVDASRLRERIPSSVQEGWRSIAPSSSASGRAALTGE